MNYKIFITHYYTISYCVSILILLNYIVNQSHLLEYLDDHLPSATPPKYLLFIGLWQYENKATWKGLWQIYLHFSPKCNLTIYFTVLIQTTQRTTNFIFCISRYIVLLFLLVYMKWIPFLNAITFAAPPLLILAF